MEIFRKGPHGFWGIFINDLLMSVDNFRSSDDARSCGIILRFGTSNTFLYSVFNSLQTLQTKDLATFKKRVSLNRYACLLTPKSQHAF